MSPLMPIKFLKEEIMEEITEKHMEKLWDMVNQKVQDALKIFQDTTNKKLVNTQKHLNELREDFNKHQSKTKTL
jgi:TPP-dependent pyruvate/acetoin dehydrogenase alpha subunit